MFIVNAQSVDILLVYCLHDMIVMPYFSHDFTIKRLNFFLLFHLFNASSNYCKFCIVSTTEAHLQFRFWHSLHKLFQGLHILRKKVHLHSYIAFEKAVVFLVYYRKKHYRMSFYILKKRVTAGRVR